MWNTSGLSQQNGSVVVFARLKESIKINAPWFWSVFIVIFQVIGEGHPGEFVTHSTPACALSPQDRRS
jgi:hypothetical protein